MRVRWRLLTLLLLIAPLLVTQNESDLDVAAKSSQQRGVPAFNYPIGDPGNALGDGFVIRHGYATENTWYLPGYLHTGEDWYREEGEAAGAAVVAVGDGEVVFAGSDYPGRVVIVRHADDLYSMYGHLDPALTVEAGDSVERGDVLGTVAERGDDVPNHLHFEMRRFLTAWEVNGAAPRYEFNCGTDCPPGPGYWPIDAPEHPSEIGWLNPTHVIASSEESFHAPEVIVAMAARQMGVSVRSEPAENAEQVARLDLNPGARFPLIDVQAGPVDTIKSSADAYDLWYRIELDDERSGWVRALESSTSEAGSDGRPSQIQLGFLPAVESDRLAAS
ncbi:MAG: M23 family metallopeptidase [Chloroflexia bacterium]|nr:M23 family metallopeptidase [Chloroflexia bacterium]